MEYRKVELMFGELIMNAVKCEWISKRPYRLYEDSDVIIQNESRIKMSDGQEIELCFWCESDIYLVDVSVDKKKYDMAGTGMSFERYMLNKGMYTENIEDVNGRWRYCGSIEHKDVYRLQYVWNGDE